MFEAFYAYLDHLLGLNQQTLTVFHMMYRAFLVYVAGMFILLINRRFVGERTPFDMMLKFIIGSTLATAITGGSPYFPTILAVLVLVTFDWLLSYLTFHSRFFEKLIKGKPITLYKNNQLQWKAMRKAHITQQDIDVELRKSGLSSLSQAEEIVFESTGDITVIGREHKQQTIDDDSAF